MRNRVIALAALLVGALACEGRSGAPDGGGSDVTRVDAPAETDDTVPDAATPWDDPAGAGAFRAGAFHASFVDPARGRELPGTLWYPTDQAAGAALPCLKGLVKDSGALANAPLATGGPFPWWSSRTATRASTSNPSS